MATPLEDALDALLSAVSTIPGLPRVYADPPESLSEFPCAIAYVTSGELSWFPGAQCTHYISLDIYHSRQILPEAVDAAKVWPNRVLTALVADGTFGGYVEAVVWPVSYEAVAMTYNNDLHYGMRFRIPLMLFNDAH